MASEKTCFKCNNVKPLSEFYRHQYMADGHLGKCKECTRNDSKSTRAANIDKYREYDRDRASTPKRKALNKSVTTKWRQEYPERRWAHMQVQYAIRKGAISPLPCWICGEKAEAHHPDYSMPLDVVWLCPAHHKQAHAIVMAA